MNRHSRGILIAQIEAYLAFYAEIDPCDRVLKAANPPYQYNLKFNFGRFH